MTSKLPSCDRPQSSVLQCAILMFRTVPSVARANCSLIRGQFLSDDVTKDVKVVMSTNAYSVFDVIR